MNPPVRPMSEARASLEPHAAAEFDIKRYEAQVLQLADFDSEDAVDLRLQEEAKSLGLGLPNINEVRLPEPVNPISSFSASTSESTVSSEMTNRDSTMSRMSQSTVATRPDSIDQRPATQASQLDRITPVVEKPVVESPPKQLPRKPRFGLLHWRRKSTTTSIPIAPASPIQTPELQSPTRRYSAPKPATPIRQSIDIAPTKQPLVRIPSHIEPVIKEEMSEGEKRLKHAMESISILKAPEWTRFIQFRDAVQTQLWTKQHEAQEALREKHVAVVKEKESANALALSKIEERQLRAENALESDLEKERRNCLTSIRHMEAYCNGAHRNPPTWTDSPDSASPVTSAHSSPPGSPRLQALATSALSSNSISTMHSTQSAERHVTNKDYMRLAQQYHARDTMETLHASRIKVLRERQDRQLATISSRMDKEVAQLESNNETELKQLLAEHEAQSSRLAAAFEARKFRLKTRLAMGELISKEKLEIGCSNTETRAVSTVDGDWSATLTLRDGVHV